MRKVKKNLALRRRREGLERNSQVVQHDRRIGRCEHTHACFFALRLRGAGAGGGGVERPAEMFARVTHADGGAIMPEHFAVERACKRKLLGKRWRPCAGTARQ